MTQKTVISFEAYSFLFFHLIYNYLPFKGNDTKLS